MLKSGKVWINVRIASIFVKREFKKWGFDWEAKRVEGKIEMNNVDNFVRNEF